MSTVELQEPPSAGGLYRRAALSMLPGLGRRGGDALPGTELVLRGVEIDRRHLAAYDRVCGFRLSDVLPATYPHVLAFPLALRLMAAADFPFPVVGVVHIGNRITQTRPLTADETLELRVWAADLRPHERGRQFDMIATATVDGQEVWRDVSTYLRKERTPGGSEPRGERERPTPPAPSAQWRVAPKVATEYAEVSGDRNPIHTSALAARAFGFPRRIAHGMWSKARCLAALEGRLPQAYTVDAAFKLPVLLPATVAFSAEHGGDGWSFALHDARTGRPHLSGEVTPAA